jgi:HK97 family phage major capsid protein
MEIKEMTPEQIEEKRAALAEEIKTADLERLDAINAELDEIEARKAEIRTEAEERAKTIAEVLEAPAEPTPIITEERTPKKMTDREIRSTQEYIDAYVDYIKNGYDINRMEKRTESPGGLLKTTNAVGGSIAVPVYVEERINAAWENNEILRRVRKTYFKGNVKVGVETDAPMAEIHKEGDPAIEPEDLVIAFVDLIPEYVKKMVKVTHSALELTGTAFLDYLFDEIEAKILERVVAQIVSHIAGSTFFREYTAQGAAITTADIINAEGMLGPNANPVIITDRATAAAIKATALAASYGYDPFDGLEVLYANTHGDLMIVDLDAVQVNLPEGDEPKFIFDEYTEAAANIVRIIGRLPVACNLVRSGSAVGITAGE